ncbi:MAG: methyltransferase [Pseudomonadales bacterium]|nr:methyltransferase [Pseudomonadales bacterium]
MSGPLLGAAALRRRLTAVNARLVEAAELLEANPFREAAPAWLDASPRLASELLRLDDATLDTLELDAAALTERLGRLDGRYATLPALTSIGRWPDRPPAVPPAEPAHVPGRKWAQIRAFLGALAPDADPAVDWCAGKGHLGRQLHLRAGAPVRCIEVDAALCAGGEALARTLPVVFERRDVIADPPELHPEERVVALHACGHLHDLLIDRSARAGVRGLAFAPCCYHLGSDRGAPWLPAAQSGPRTGLPDELVRFAVRETVTAPRYVRRRRRLERSYRLAFEALRRELDARRPDYRAIPSVPGRLLSAGFPAFCAHAAAHLGLELPAELDAEHWLALGTQADARARRLELARAPFRRLLELRMVLDRALALAEAGYAVGVGEFCERALTPRNLLIIAERLT